MEKFDIKGDFIIMTAAQVRSFDRRAIEQLGVPGAVLMENAGRSCAELIEKTLENTPTPNVCIFCGTGNNGGDGFVIARHLRNNGIEAKIVICGDASKIKSDAMINLNIWQKTAGRTDVLNMSGDIPQQIKTLTKKSNLIVDAIFGTGLSGKIRNNYKQLVDTINSLNKPVVAVDIPSGLHCDSGVPLGCAIRANCTVTFAAVKKGFTNPNSKEFTGDVFVASIGTEPVAGKDY